MSIHTVGPGSHRVNNFHEPAAVRSLSVAERRELRIHPARLWEGEAGFRPRRLRAAEFNLKRYIWFQTVIRGIASAEIRPARLAKLFDCHPNTIRAARRSLEELGYIATLDARPGRPVRVVLGWRRVAELREIATRLDARDGLDCEGLCEGTCEGNPNKSAAEVAARSTVTESTGVRSVSSAFSEEGNLSRDPKRELVSKRPDPAPVSHEGFTLSPNGKHDAEIHLDRFQDPDAVERYGPKFKTLCREIGLRASVAQFWAKTWHLASLMELAGEAVEKATKNTAGYLCRMVRRAEAKGELMPARGGMS